MKYRDGQRVVVKTIKGLNDDAKILYDKKHFYKGGKDVMRVGDEVVVRYRKGNSSDFYELHYDNGLVSEDLTEQELDVIVGNQLNVENNKSDNFKLNIKAEIDRDSLAEIHILIDELENRLHNLKINFKI